MNYRLQVSQIFLPNSKQATNFVSLYEETINERRTNVSGLGDQTQLFLIVEIKGNSKSSLGKRKDDFEKLTQTIAKSLKQTYLAETKITESVFEKALGNINAELATQARHGVVAWYKKINALIAVFHKNNLSVATVGTASAFLLRGKEFMQISEESEKNLSPNPLKTFLNFSSGNLTADDCLIFSTANFYNYVSLEKLRQLLYEQLLDEATRQLITVVKQDASSADSFATFICRAHSRLHLPDSELGTLMSPANHTIIEDRQRLATSRITRTAQVIQNVLKIFIGGGKNFIIWCFRSLKNFSGVTTPPHHTSFPLPKKTSKKTLLWVFASAIFLLATFLISFNLQNNQSKIEQQNSLLLEQAKQNTADAEAAMIYGDQNRSVNSIAQAKSQLDQTKETKSQVEEISKLREKIDKIANQLNKINLIAQTETLAQFSNSPNHLIKIKDGFMAFNSFTDTFAVYDSGGVKNLSLQNPVPENIESCAFFEVSQSIICMASSGNFYGLDLSSQDLKLLEPKNSDGTNPKQLSNLNSFGGRSYALSINNSQIVRFNKVENGFGQAQDWLKIASDFSESRDMIVDGSVYVLFPSSILKFVKGQQEEFSLSAFKPPLENALKIFTTPEQQYIYVAETKHFRVIIFNKQGQLAAQLVSKEYFGELKDLWADEKAKLLYFLSGDKLLRFRY